MCIVSAVLRMKNEDTLVYAVPSQMKGRARMQGVRDRQRKKRNNQSVYVVSSQVKGRAWMQEVRERQKETQGSIC